MKSIKRPLLMILKDQLRGTWLGRTKAAATGYRLLSQVVYGSPQLKVSFRGFSIEIEPTDQSMVTGILNGTYEFDELNRVEAVLKAGDCFVDVGANVGLYTLVAARKVTSSGQVLAFEPSKLARQKLHKNLTVSNLSQVKVFPKGLSDRIGKAYLCHPEEGLGSSHLSLQIAGQMRGDEIEVSTLDHELRPLTVNSLRLIKIDVEGFEPEVIKGAQETLSRYQPEVLVEFNPALLASRMINKFYWLDKVVTPFQNIHKFGPGGAVLPTTQHELMKEKNLVNLLLSDFLTSPSVRGTADSNETTPHSI